MAQFVEGDVFRITIPLTEVATATVGPNIITQKNGAISGVLNGAINLSDTEQKLLQFLKDNPRATKPIMASSLGIGDGTVERAIKKLKTYNLPKCTVKPLPCIIFFFLVSYSFS